MKNLLRAIWGAYGLLVFAFWILLFFPFYVLMFLIWGEKITPIVIRLSHHVVAKLTLIFYLIRLKVSGKEHIEKGKSYVIVCNHASQLDILSSALSFPGVYKFLAKKEASKTPVFGWVVRKLTILVDRKDPDSRKKSYEYMAKTLEDGYSVLLYPEGTRNRTQEPLKKFYDGAFRLAIQSQTPILVQTLINTQKLSNPNRPLDLAPGVIYAHFDEPIETKGMTMDEMEDLKMKVRTMMEKHLLA